VLYAPGLRTRQEIQSVCESLSKPVNVLGHRGLSLSEIVEAGARRISVGGALTWSGVAAMAAAAEKMRDTGDFSGLAGPGRIAEWLGSD
jgi:2-methylisocitrate lyase-like PEP mutase family enzyme